jgi:ribosomal protein S6--L-glutamate ligase
MLPFVRKQREKKQRTKTLIGWQEWCAMPDLDLPAVKAKIDTGARTSTLHAYDIKIFLRSDGQKMVEFKVHPLQGSKLEKICLAPLVDNRVIISSNGERERRPVILTRLICGEKEILAEVTLTSRHKMSFRMLLGRAAVRKFRYAVYPGKTFLLGKVQNAKTLYNA